MARPVPRLPRSVRLQAVEVLSAPRSLDGVAAGCPTTGVKAHLPPAPSDLVQIEIAHRLGDRLFLRLTQRLFEAAGQRIAARLLGFDRLLEECLAPPRLFGKNPRGFVQLRLVAALRLLVRNDTPEVGVDYEQRAAAWT